MNKTCVCILLFASLIFFIPIFSNAQAGLGLPVWYVSTQNNLGILKIDWRKTPVEAEMITATGPRSQTPAFPAINPCGDVVFFVAHTGIRNSPTDLFIYGPEGQPLLTDNTPNGPGLNAKLAGYETHVIPVPNQPGFWYIIYPEWKTDNGAPLGNGAYTHARIMYSKIKYSCGEIIVIDRDLPVRANNTEYTYTNGMAVGILPGSDVFCLYLVRRSPGNDYLSVDRFKILPEGIIFDQNTGGIYADDWNLTVECASIEVSNDGKRIVIINRNQDVNWNDIFLLDAIAFNNTPSACLGICAGDLILQPDNQVLYSPGAVNSLCYSNNNLYFLRNLERKIGDVEFSPDGRFVYFAIGGFVEGYYSNVTYLGQIEIGTYENPAPYPFKLRLQAQRPPGTLDPVTGRGGLESTHQGQIFATIYLSKSYDGIMYFSKRDASMLFSIPAPDDYLPQQLVPSDIDLSDVGHPNIPIEGTFRSLPDQIDGYNYITHQKPVISLGNDTVICSGQSVALSPGTQFASYCWHDGSSLPVYITSDPGLYWVEIIDDLGCFARDSVSVEVMEGQVSLGDAPAICEGDSVYLTPGTGYESYLWNDGSEQQGISVKTGGLYWVEVTAIGGCHARDSVYVTVNPLPQVYLGPDTSIKSGEKLVLDAGSGFLSYLWHDGSTGQTHEVSDAGTCWVTIDNGLCKNSDTIEVILDDCEARIFVPNCFTPNSDGYNDRFNAVTENLSVFHMMIFNRWGQQLFETNDPNEGWDGKLNGTLCPQGTYFYLIRYQSPCNLGVGKAGERKGSVTLLL